jgi:hypothetical protein
MVLPPGAQLVTRVVACVLEHDDDGLLSRNSAGTQQELSSKRLGQLLPKGHERGLAFLIASLVHTPSVRVVARADAADAAAAAADACVVVARRRHPQWLSRASPALCHVGVRVDCTVVPRSPQRPDGLLRAGGLAGWRAGGLSTRLFVGSQSSTGLAAATAAASWRCRRSGRGRREQEPSVCTTR